MDSRNHDYAHTQAAPLCLLLYGAALLCFIGAAWAQETPGLSVAGGVGLLLLVLAPAFHHLTVEDYGDVLGMQFGPLPLFARNVRYEDIAGVEKERTRATGATRPPSSRRRPSCMPVRMTSCRSPTARNCSGRAARHMML